MKNLLKFTTTTIMTLLAKRALLRHKPLVVAVTGSVGKTTSKDAIAHVLGAHARVRKSEKSFNSEIGLPLAVFALPNAWMSPFGWARNILSAIVQTYGTAHFPELLVLEIGADKMGDIGQAVQWIHPKIGVLTCLPDRPVHVGNFPSPEHVRLEKKKLITALPPDGIFIANADDEKVMSFANTSTLKVISYGFSDKASVRGKNSRPYFDDDHKGKLLGIEMEVQFKDEVATVKIAGVLGEHILSAALCAIAVGLAEGIDFNSAVESVQSWVTAPGRMRLIEGKGGATIIDDSYNASPVAMRAALKTLQQIPAQRRIAVLGDMLELGEYTEEEHRNVGAYAASFVDELVLVGKYSSFTKEAAIAAGLKSESIRIFQNSFEAGEALAGEIREHDVILVKGSQGSGKGMVRMERATKQMMKDMSKASASLVRQESEWQRQYTK